MVRTMSMIAAAAVALEGCATAPPPQQPDITVYTGRPNPIPEDIKAAHLAERERMQAAGQSARHPVGPEVLAFQEYGRTIADQVSSDPHFGGFVFRSEPEPHAIVMFTGNAEARLRRYTRDPRFKAKRVDITLAYLERMKEQTTRQLMALRLDCWTSDADEEHNTVTVTTPEVDKVRAAIAEGRFRPPPKFRLLPGSCVTWR